MNNLIIIGARGFGREVYNLFLDCYKDDREWSCKGYLDSKSDALDGYEGYPPILCSPEDYVIDKDDVFVCALGDVKWKKYHGDLMSDKGASFVSLIHPTAKVSMNTTFGSGCIITANVLLSCDVHVGKFVTIMRNAVLGHDCKINDWSHLGAFTFFGGFSEIGRLCTVHPGAQILPHKKVKDNAVVGAGSVVILTVKEGTTVMGIPAKKMDY